MRSVQILQQTIENQCPKIHKKRLSSLILATKTVLDGSDLTLTKIGRALDTNTTVKHAIINSGHTPKDQDLAGSTLGI
ncbi:hypothetical protein VINE108274_23750 [Vibrio neptunius]